MTSSPEPLRKTLLAGLEDFLLGWKSSFWGGRFLGGALISSSEPLKTLLVGLEDSLLDGKSSCCLLHFATEMARAHVRAFWKHYCMWRNDYIRSGFQADVSCLGA